MCTCNCNTNFVFTLFFLNSKFTQLGDYEGLSNEDMLLRLRRETPFEYAIVPRPWYKRYSSVVGWTDFIKSYVVPLAKKQSIPYVSTYSDSFNSMSDAELTAHLVHEVACHGNGFSHSFKYNDERNQSVPYAVGSFVESFMKAD